MKNISALFIFLGFTLCLSTCSDVVNPHNSERTAAETGRVALSVTGTVERAIMPQSPVFARYEFSFEPLNGQQKPGNVTITPSEITSKTVNLEPGELGHYCHWLGIYQRH